MTTITRLLATSALLLGVAAPAAAQELKLPAPSPGAMVQQTVGVTSVSVEYSSPGVKDRTIFGELVAFDKLWRTGANSATTLTLSTDAKIAGKLVPAGTYALFTIPGKKMWTLILNKNAKQGGTRSYDQKLDQLRVQIAPGQANASRERLTFLFEDTTDTTTNLVLAWDELRLVIPIEVATKDLATANVTALVGGSWRTIASGARYLKDAGDLDGALKLIDASIALNADFYNVFVKAQVLAAKGDKKAAAKEAQRAHDLGMKADYFFWKDLVEKSIKEWRK